MKKILACLLSVMLLCGVSFSFAIASANTSTLNIDDMYVEGFTIDKLSTRSGPSTAYRDTGTYDVKGQWIHILSYTFDNGGVCWVQCDVPYRDQLRRVYTGLKRFDASTVNLDYVPMEDPTYFASVKVLKTASAYYGPDDRFSKYGSLTVDRGQTVKLLEIIDNSAMVEWTTSKQSYRAWVPIDVLDYFY